MVICLSFEYDMRRMDMDAFSYSPVMLHNVFAEAQAPKRSGLCDGLVERLSMAWIKVCAWTRGVYSVTGKRRRAPWPFKVLHRTDLALDGWAFDMLPGFRNGQSAKMGARCVEIRSAT